jgi:ADP-ribose pyrophosphatase YjhB (NUDIX family)
MTEKIRIRPATIVLNDNKVLLVKSQYGEEEFFLFPGGGLEFGETIEEGAMRETLEETGIKIKIKKLIHINEYIYRKDFAKRSITFFFLAEPLAGQEINIQTTDGGKIKEAIWIDIEKLNKIDIRPKILIEGIKNYLIKNDFSISPYSIDYKE